MFDVGFSELFMIAVIALVVLGPERLPKAARLVGLWLRRARAHWYSVKDELTRELQAEEMKRQLRETQHDLKEAQGALDLQKELDTFESDVERNAPSTSTPPPQGQRPEP